MSNELIVAWSTAAVAIIGAFGLFIERFVKSRNRSKIAETSDGIRSAAANRKLEQGKRDAVLAEWQDLYERGQLRNNELLKQLDDKMLEFEKRIGAIQQEHLKCAVELSAANTQIHELKDQNQRQEARIAMLEKRGQ